jgi:glycerol-3-phosphate dehydrogenase
MTGCRRPLARHYVRLYGTRADQVIGNAPVAARARPPLRRPAVRAGSALSAAKAEWAHTAEDILQRRTKHGLHLERSLRDAFEDWLRAA